MEKDNSKHSKQLFSISNEIAGLHDQIQSLERKMREMQHQANASNIFQTIDELDQMSDEIFKLERCKEQLEHKRLSLYYDNMIGRE